jgi:hypothetical protein
MLPMACAMHHILTGTISPLSSDRRRRTVVRWLLPAVVLVAALFGAEQANAGVLTASVTSCDDPPLERPFTPWLDGMQYVLAPDGDFDRDAAGWQLASAAVVADNEPWNVHGSERTAALRLAGDGSATSPVMCVGVEHPTLRLFARNRGSVLGTLGVEVLFEDALGETRSLPIGTVLGGGWAPTLPMPVLANLLTLLPGERTPVAFRFTARGGDWTIDDVFVDPWGKG